VTADHLANWFCGNEDAANAKKMQQSNALLRVVHRLSMALDRVFDSVGSLMIHAHYAVCAKGDGQDFDDGRAEWWASDGI
jgi:hypothetical protein